MISDWRSKRFAAALILAVLATATARAQDPSGFVDFLNAERARRGLAPVAYDPGAVPTAEANSRAMAASNCVGHFVMGGLGQCSAYAGDAGSALAMWAASPAHAGLLFAPDLASVGYSAWGPWATVSTRQGFAAPAPLSYPAPAVYAVPYPCMQPGAVWYGPAAGRCRRWRR